MERVLRCREAPFKGRKGRDRQGLHRTAQAPHKSARKKILRRMGLRPHRLQRSKPPSRVWSGRLALDGAKGAKEKPLRCPPGLLLSMQHIAFMPHVGKGFGRHPDTGRSFKSLINVLHFNNAPMMQVIH